MLLRLLFLCCVLPVLAQAQLRVQTQVLHDDLSQPQKVFFYTGHLLNEKIGWNLYPAAATYALLEWPTHTQILTLKDTLCRGKACKPSDFDTTHQVQGQNTNGEIILLRTSAMQLESMLTLRMLHDFCACDDVLLKAKYHKLVPEDAEYMEAMLCIEALEQLTQQFDDEEKESKIMDKSLELAARVCPETFELFLDVMKDRAATNTSQEDTEAPQHSE